MMVIHLVETAICFQALTCVCVCGSVWRKEESKRDDERKGGIGERK